MIPKQAIEKAIEGGWQDGQALDPKRIDVTGMGYIRIYQWDSSEFNGYDWQELALDPTFWQALGKALGWRDGGGKNHDPQWIVHYNVDVETITAKWLNWQMEFNYLILTGGDTDKFWRELLD